MVAKAHAVILTPVPYGHGNLANLELLQYALDQSIPVVLYKLGRSRVMDYTTGKKAEKYLAQIEDKVLFCETDKELYDFFAGLSTRVGD